MELSKREIWALKEMIMFDIKRYLMANSCHRLDGYEKAQRHTTISKILCRFINASENADAWKQVHDYLADILTDRMDEVIGFPIDVPVVGSDYDILGDRFFNTIIGHFNEIEEIVKSNTENYGT
jgi:hemoglobin-like flavoprotein